MQAGIATALRELRAGRKTSHWIWYVFPQIAGLGRSPVAQQFAIEDAEEAKAYLGDSLLGDRLIVATEAVHAHLDTVTPVRLETLMGSRIDAVKLVSSMTLFARAARPAAADRGAPVRTHGRPGRVRSGGCKAAGLPPVPTHRACAGLTGPRPFRLRSAACPPDRPVVP